MIEIAIPEQLKQYPELPKNISLDPLKTLSDKIGQYDRTTMDEYRQIPLDLDLYVKDSRFNPLREINKEKNLAEFFSMKKQLVDNYL